MSKRSAPLDFASLAVSKSPAAATDGSTTFMVDHSLTGGFDSEPQPRTPESRAAEPHISTDTNAHMASYNIHGKSILFIGDSKTICRAFIGNEAVSSGGEGKFCCNTIKSCSVSKHKMAGERFDIKPGHAFLKSKNNKHHAYCNPSTSLHNKPIEFISDLSNAEYGPKEWTKVCSVLNSHSESLSSMTELNTGLNSFDAAFEYKTPAKKRKPSILDIDEEDLAEYAAGTNSVMDPIIDENLTNQAEMEESLNEAASTTIEGAVPIISEHILHIRDVIEAIVHHTVPALDARTEKLSSEQSEAAENILLRVVQMEHIIGSISDHVTNVTGPTIWGSIAHLLDSQTESVREIRELEKLKQQAHELQRSAGLVQNHEQSLTSLHPVIASFRDLLADFQIQIPDLKNQVASISASLNNLHHPNANSSTTGLQSNPSVGGHLSWGGPVPKVGVAAQAASNKTVTTSNVTSSTMSSASSGNSIAALNTLINKLQKDVQSLETEFASFKSNGTNTERAVILNQQVFKSVNDVDAWLTQYVPVSGNCIPFGCFVDPHNLLQRVYSSASHLQTSLKDMDLRSRLQLTINDCRAIESYDSPIPILFTNTSKEGSLIFLGNDKTCLGAMKTVNDWYSEGNQTGIRAIIQVELKHVVESVRQNISENLRTQEAIGLAETMLAQATLFITKLLEYISQTYRELTTAGTPTTESWYLVTKIIRDMFVVSFAKERAGVREQVNANTPQRTAAHLMWGTFKTMGLAQEFLQYNIVNHPSISTSYVRFVVQHSSLGKVESIVAEMKKLKSENEQLRKDNKTLQSDLKKATSTADSAISKVKDLENNWRKFKRSNPTLKFD